MRFFSDSIAKTILNYEIELDAGQQQNNVSRCFAPWDESALRQVFQHNTNYNIDEVFFLIDSAARICHEFIKFNKLDPRSNIDIWRGSITERIILRERVIRK